MATYTNLIMGVNLYGFTAGANMQPGEACDAVNVLPRPDGSLVKHYGARRISASRFTAGGDPDPVLGQIGFTYKGKNNDPVTNPARPGNFALPDDDAIFTRRDDFYPGALVLTETAAYFWDHTTRDFTSVALPGGVTVDPNPRPTMLVLQNNVYICGWATANLRYDPTDRALYVWGWDSLPTLGAPTVGAGGTLRPNVTYKYRAAWIDLYTGEQSGLGPELSAVTTDTNRTITFGATDFPVYAGTRHFRDAVNVTNQDVGIVLYRTEGNEERFHFLDLIEPDLAAATLTDNGLFTDTARKASIVAFEDPKRYSGMVEYRNMVYGVSWDDAEGSTRAYFNDFTGTKSHYERTRPLNFRELPLTDGEVMTAVAKTSRNVVFFSNKSAYEMQVFANRQTGQIQQVLNPLDWTVGCVGPLAWEYLDGWLYFLSDRGPYRWQPGLAEPQWIGKNLLPMFIDPTSGMCQLNPALKWKSEVFYDRDADVIRYVFPLGNSDCEDTLNGHIYQYPREQFVGDPYHGWFFGQPGIHSFSHHASFGIMNPDTGQPESQFDRKPLLAFADNDGFIYQYDPALLAFGLPDGAVGRYIADSGTTTTASVGGGLYTSGDGLEGLRVEVVHAATGVIEVRTVASNTGSVITFDTPLVTAVVSGDTIFIGGFKAYWRSWLDHGGDPALTKKSVHFWLGLNKTVGGEAELDVVMAAGDDIPATPRRTRRVKMTANQQKLLSSLTGRWFLWEFANSHPGEPFHVSFIRTDLSPFEQERR